MCVCVFVCVCLCVCVCVCVCVAVATTGDYDNDILLFVKYILILNSQYNNYYYLSYTCTLFKL